ncbi:MAG: FAD:protein FMN transferase, partial [Deltaproteobacteria bacterium]|nr:FAD:protein FMN transferase [Deltaproteobacteria bacterium]
QAHTRVGSEKLQLSSDGRVSLTRRGMAIDLGGIGKGYALDQLAVRLRTQGIANALLDFGQSSIWALGAPPDAPGWRLLVQQPDGRTAGVITLRDQALSVSGSLGQSVTINGQRYGHVIDPRSGEPLRRDLLACVIAPSAAQAEALSKALLILGEQEGIALLRDLPGVEGLLTEASGQRWMTAGWAQATAFVP